ncbi:MAG TPA: membrane protein insertion efficiency factor YidD [Acidimicrobiales bacterium]
MHNSISTSAPPLTERLPARSLLARALLGAVHLYQRVTRGRVAPCRFYPSCSDYAAEALEGHGAVRGSFLALRRLSKCRPLGPHGIDLVPESRYRSID